LHRDHRPPGDHPGEHHLPGPGSLHRRTGGCSQVHTPVPREPGLRRRIEFATHLWLVRTAAHGPGIPGHRGCSHRVRGNDGRHLRPRTDAGRGRSQQTRRRRHRTRQYHHERQRDRAAPPPARTPGPESSAAATVIRPATRPRTPTPCATAWPVATRAATTWPVATSHATGPGPASTPPNTHVPIPPGPVRGRVPPTRGLWTTRHERRPGQHRTARTWPPAAKAPLPPTTAPLAPTKAPPPPTTAPPPPIHTVGPVTNQPP